MHLVFNEPADYAETGNLSKAAIQALRFEQVNILLIRGTTATNLTKSVRLEMGQYWEIILFVIVPKMTGAVILELAWLDK